jgi:hypothetical protein
VLVSDGTHSDNKAKEARRLDRVLIILLHILARHDNIAAMRYGQAQKCGRNTFPRQLVLADDALQLGLVFLLGELAVLVLLQQASTFLHLQAPTEMWVIWRQHGFPCLSRFTPSLVVAVHRKLHD